MCIRDERADFLGVALESLVNQTLQDFEIVLIDDGSTNEATLEAMNAWAGRDARVRFFREPPRGLTHSLNVGLGHCRATFVARHDSDDWSEPDRLSRQVSFLNEHPDVGLVGSQICAHMSNGKTLWLSRLPIEHAGIKAAFPQFNPFCHGAVVYRLHLAESINGYRGRFACSQDYDFFWRLSEVTRVRNLAQVLYHYRYGGSSISSQRAADQATVAAATRVLARMRMSGREDVDLAFDEAKKALASVDLAALALRKHAEGLLVGGQYRQALQAFGKLLAASPLKLASYACLLRCVLFITLPPARAYLFGR
jgi:glycosyltransferase involved in cell wall biosynthesis